MKNQPKEYVKKISVTLLIRPVNVENVLPVYFVSPGHSLIQSNKFLQLQIAILIGKFVEMQQPKARSVQQSGWLAILQRIVQWKKPNFGLWVSVDHSFLWIPVGLPWRWALLNFGCQHSPSFILTGSKGWACCRHWTGIAKHSF